MRSTDLRMSYVHLPPSSAIASCSRYDRRSNVGRLRRKNDSRVQRPAERLDTSGAASACTGSCDTGDRAPIATTLRLCLLPLVRKFEWRTLGRGLAG
jgi:hypothetical protein